MKLFSRHAESLETTMRHIGHKAVCIIASAALVVGLCPGLAVAEPGQAQVADGMPSASTGVSSGEPAVEDDAIDVQSDFVQGDYSVEGESPDNDELFDAYVQQRLQQGSCSEGMSAQSLPAGDNNNLTDVELAIFNALKEPIADVAAGNRVSTEFTIPVTALGISAAYTASDLGVKTLYDEYGIVPQAQAALQAKLPSLQSMRHVIDALRIDCPYELYWFDVTDGYSYGFGQVQIRGPRVVLTDMVVRFSVSEGYQGDADYTVDSRRPARVGTAIAKATSIVNANKGKSVRDMLAAYLQEICSLASYNDVAASGTVPYGDPWQMIYVFDGDPDTKVVCEGYAKAFEYLCDKSSLGDVNCYTVMGKMLGGTGYGDHMWNLVHMDNGLNYLVDPTNCDTGTIGSPDQLFLAYAPSGSVASEYTFLLNGGKITYTYDNNVKSLFPESVLKIADVPYGSGERVSIAGANVAVSGTYVYDGTAKEPAAKDVTVTLNGKTLAYGSDYTYTVSNNVEVGTAEVTVEGVGSYRGTAKGEFTIARGDVSKAVVTTLPSVTYNGLPKEPDPEVVLNGVVLAKGKDYTVSYADNVNAGTATVTVTGTGQYAGSKTSTFEIRRASMDLASVSDIPNQMYTGFPIEPKPVVTLGGRTLVEGADYTVSYAKNVSAGVATVTITATGNYESLSPKWTTFYITVVTEKMYRMYNQYSGEHFYTAKEEERIDLVNAGWTYEGIGWKAPTSSAKPVYRLYNRYAPGGDHHYTMNASEREILKQEGWTDEGIGWYSAGEEGVAVYRQYNRNEFAHNHNYTADQAEKDMLIGVGWDDEGIAWYGMPALL